jgi:hypothetical protein
MVYELLEGAIWKFETCIIEYSVSGLSPQASLEITEMAGSAGERIMATC